MPSRRIKDAHPLLQDAWPLMKADFENKFWSWTLHLACTHRPPEEQFDLFKKGRMWDSHLKKWVIFQSSAKVTNCDGTEKMSYHNYYPALAIDVWIADRNGASFYPDNPAGSFQWPFVAHLAQKYGFESGSTWKSFQDWPHIQLAKDDIEKAIKVSGYR